jgi:predicted transcriptional regulator
VRETDSAATVEVEVPDEAMVLLRRIAKARNCTLNAALEEAIRELWFRRSKAICEAERGS